MGRSIDELLDRLGIDDEDPDSRFTPLLGEADDVVVIPKTALLEIERKFKTMHEVSFMVRAIRRTLQFQVDCRECMVPDFVEKFGDNTFITGELQDAEDMLHGIVDQMRHEIMKVVDGCIKQQVRLP